MEKLSAVARALAILIAIVAVFVAIPQTVAILLVLGAVSGLDNSAETSLRVYVVTLVLLMGARTLEAIPAVGVPLADIFSNIGLAMLGYSIAAITIRMGMKLKNDWVK